MAEPRSAFARRGNATALDRAELRQSNLSWGTLPPEYTIDRDVDLSGKTRSQTIRITDNVYIVVNMPYKSQGENTRRDYRVDIINGGTTRLSNGETRGYGGGGTWIDVAVDRTHSEQAAKQQIKKAVNDFIERVRRR